MIEIFLINLLILLFLHALADFAFQSDVMAKCKNRLRDKERKNRWKHGNHKDIIIPEGQKYQLTWYYWLTAHALIHGGLIGFIFGNWIIGFIEVLAHFVIDFLKTHNYTNIHHDQGMHLILRIIYAWCLI